MKGNGRWGHRQMLKYNFCEACEASLLEKAKLV